MIYGFPKYFLTYMYLYVQIFMASYLEFMLLKDLNRTFLFPPVLRHYEVYCCLYVCSD